MTRSSYMRLEKKLHVLEYKLQPLRNITKQTRNLKFPLYFSFRSRGPQKAKYCSGSLFAYLEITGTKNIQKIILRYINCKVLVLTQVPGNTSVALLRTDALSLYLQEIFCFNYSYIWVWLASQQLGIKVDEDLMKERGLQRY